MSNMMGLWQGPTAGFFMLASCQLLWRPITACDPFKSPEQDCKDVSATKERTRVAFNLPLCTNDVCT